MDRDSIKAQIEEYLEKAAKFGRYDGPNRDNALALAEGWSKYLAAEGN